MSRSMFIERYNHHGKIVEECELQVSIQGNADRLYMHVVGEKVTKMYVLDLNELYLILQDAIDDYQRRQSITRRVK